MISQMDLRFIYIYIFFGLHFNYFSLIFNAIIFRLNLIIFSINFRYLKNELMEKENIIIIYIIFVNP